MAGVVVGVVAGKEDELGLAIFVIGEAEGFLEKSFASILQSDRRTTLLNAKCCSFCTNPSLESSIEIPHCELAIGLEKKPVWIVAGSSSP